MFASVQQVQGTVEACLSQIAARRPLLAAGDSWMHAPGLMKGDIVCGVRRVHLRGRKPIDGFATEGG